MTIKEIKKELNINDSDIAKAFGFKDANNYRNSSAKPRFEKGIEWFYQIALQKRKSEGKENEG